MRVPIRKNRPFNDINGIVKVEMTREILQLDIIVNLKRKIGTEAAADNFQLHIGGQYLCSVVAQDIAFGFIRTDPLRIRMHRTGTSPRSEQRQHPPFH